MLSIIVAIAQNNVIGRDKRLAWHLPNDLKRFRQITLTGSKTLIMGRKTFESLPKVLPGRKHIVLTQNREYKVDDENIAIVHSIGDIMPFINSEEEYFVIGGGQIFNMLLPYAKKMYITQVHEDFEGDTFFPGYEKHEWVLKEKREGIVDEKNRHEHSFLVFEKI